MAIYHGALPDLVIARQKKGVSLQDIAASTKIGVTYLQAIEEGTFEKLPGGIYTTSYIRQYARAVDYDENELVRHYYVVTGVEPPEPEAARSKRSFAHIVRQARVLS
jgi:cytoskeletal protein RodZ